MKKVLITGATGFIGGNLLKANILKGNKVRAFVLPGDEGEAALKTQDVEVYNGDIRNYNDVKKAVSGVDIVFNCAAIVTDWAPWKLFQEVTIGGIENVCKASVEAGVSRLVDISTNDVFGTDESRVMDETFPLKPWGEPYPDAKIEAEKITWRYYNEKKLPVTMVYPCWAFGHGDKTFVPLLADSIIKRELIFWRKDVLVWPTYIENLVDLLLLISEDDRAVGNGYLVHDGESVTLQDFCRGIADTLGVKPINTHIPYFAAYGAAVVMEALWKVLNIKNLGSRLKFSITKAERELGWKPKVPFKQGFARTMEWLKTLDIKTLKQK